MRVFFYKQKYSLQCSEIIKSMKNFIMTLGVVNLGIDFAKSSLKISIGFIDIRWIPTYFKKLLAILCHRYLRRRKKKKKPYCFTGFLAYLRYLISAVTASK